MKKTSTLTAIALSLTAFSSANAEKVKFEEQIWPIIKERCVNCHRAPYEENGRPKKPKAGLRLDAASEIMKGSENGPVIEKGNVDKSYFYEVLVLPKDDDMFMPPKGDPCTEAEIALIKKWIEEGADFGGWEGAKVEEIASASNAHSPSAPKPSIYDVMAEGVNPAAEASVKKVSDAGGRVSPLAQNHPLVRVDYLMSAGDTGNEQIASLAAVKDNLAQLDLAKTKVTDDGLSVLSGMPRLARLDLHSTEVGDGALKHLSGLTELRYLNLYDTEVTDAGLDALSGLKNLEGLYLWQSKVTEAGIKKLQSNLPDTAIVWK